MKQQAGDFSGTGHQGMRFFHNREEIPVSHSKRVWQAKAHVKQWCHDLMIKACCSVVYPEKQLAQGLIPTWRRARDNFSSSKSTPVQTCECLSHLRAHSTHQSLCILCPPLVRDGLAASGMEIHRYHIKSTMIIILTGVKGKKRRKLIKTLPLHWLPQTGLFFTCLFSLHPAWLDRFKRCASTWNCSSYYILKKALTYS